MPRSCPAMLALLPSHALAKESHENPRAKRATRVRDRRFMVSSVPASPLGGWAKPGLASTAARMATAPALKQTRLLAVHTDQLAARRQTLYARELFERSASVGAKSDW
jgi:hypothetical protein